MAQLASASGLGPEGPVFESQYPDKKVEKNSGSCTKLSEFLHLRADVKDGSIRPKDAKMKNGARLILLAAPFIMSKNRYS